MTLEELDEYLCELETDIEKKVEWTLTDYVSLANAKKYTSEMQNSINALKDKVNELKKAGLVGVVSILVGVVVSFIVGAIVAIAYGYSNPVDITTIGAGAVTYIVGPVTGSALGASSEIIALSVAAGLVKSILVMIGTPIIARFIGLNNPQSAMVFGGLMGTTSGVAAGLAATDPKLVPYGAMTATFYTGLGCLLGPSILFFIVRGLV